MPTPFSRRPVTTADYHSLIESGVLTENEPVELLAGEMYLAEAIGSRHHGCLLRLQHWLADRIAGRALVSIQGPLELSLTSEPEPDLMLLVPDDRFYSDRNPRPEEVLLLVEVADTSLRYDRELKLPLYAEAGVREVWIVALEERVVHRFREPAQGEYAVHERLAGGVVVSPEAFPDLRLSVALPFG